MRETSRVSIRVLRMCTNLSQWHSKGKLSLCLQDLQEEQISWISEQKKENDGLRRWFHG